MRWAVIVALALGCKDRGIDPDTGIDWGEPKPWQVTGEAGSLVVTRLETDSNPVVEIFGVFADSTQGYITAGACAQQRLPCVREVPAPDDFERANNNLFRPVGSDYRWVGDQIYVGSTQVDFQHDLERGMAYYYGRSEGRPDGDLRLRLGGEWADFDLPLVRMPPGLQVTAPILGVDERLDFSGGSIDFTWDSDGLQEVWLWVDGPKTRRLYRLADDGEFTLSPGSLNLDPAEVLDVGLAAARRGRYDIAGNALDVVTLAGAGWKASECGAWLDVPLVGGNPDPTPMPVPTFMGWGFRGLVDDGVHDFYDPDTSEPTSAELYFTFYDGSFNELCRIRYEADMAARRDPMIVASGARIFQSWNVALFNGLSTCGAVPEAMFGSSDLRDYVEQFDWSFAVGEMVELEEPLSEAFGPITWPNQSRFIYSTFWSRDGLFGDERGYGYAFETDSCFQGNPGAVLPSPVPPDPDSLSSIDRGMPPAYYFTFPYYVERVP